MLIKYKRVYYVILIIICTGIFIPVIETDNLWGDEGFTVRLMHMNFADLIRATANDVHPPLYYIIAKCATNLFGIHLMVLRIVSIIPTVFTMILGATIVDQEFGDESIWIPSMFIVALVGAPNLFRVAVEVRMYSWTMFFVTLTALLAHRIYRKRHTAVELLCLCIAGLGAAYSHYFGLVAVIIIYVIFFLFLLRDNAKNLKICGFIMVVSVVGYAPWLIRFYGQLRSVSKDYWIPQLTNHHIRNFIEHPLVTEQGTFYGDYIMVLQCVLIMIVFYGMYQLFLNKRIPRGEVCVALLYIGLMYGVALAGVTVSLIVRPILLERYLTPCLPIFWLGISILICKMKYGKVLASLLIVALIVNAHYEYRLERSDVVQEGMNVFDDEVYSTNPEETVLLSDIFHLSWTLLEYYYPEYERESVQITENTKEIVEYPYIEGKQYYIFTGQDLGGVMVGDSNEFIKVGESFVPDIGIVYLYEQREMISKDI